MGGLTGVGISHGGRYLLATSHTGRGVFDLGSGARVARDSNEHFAFDEITRLAFGIGPVESEQIAIAGLWGGSLPTRTPDGWTLSVAGGEAVQVRDPAGNLASLLESAAELRAAGFSPNGTTLIHATSADLTLYMRAEGAA